MGIVDVGRASAWMLGKYQPGKVGAEDMGRDLGGGHSLFSNEAVARRLPPVQSPAGAS